MINRKKCKEEGQKMKAIIVYFSLEGDSKYVADKIAQIIGADTLRIEPIKAYPTSRIKKYIWGGKSVIFREKPKLKQYEFTKRHYDLVIVGSPVWAGTYAPPLKSFFKDNKIASKKIALYCCCGGGSTEKCLRKMQEDSQARGLVPTLSLVEPAKNPTKEVEEKIEQFCKKLKRL